MFTHHDGLPLPLTAGGLIHVQPGLALWKGALVIDACEFAVWLCVAPNLFATDFLPQFVLLGLAAVATAV